jgi:Zn finger protein HypA/HybF involved in hydrogenase expression
MLDYEPVEINGETFEPVAVACPSCDAEIDAQRALVAGECPECRTAARALMDGETDVPDDYEPESYQVEA